MSNGKLYLTVVALVALVMLFVFDATTGIAQTPCADYISGTADNPATGTLIGQSRVTLTTTTTTGASGGANAEGSVGVATVGANIGGDKSNSTTTVEEFYVGTYIMFPGQERIQVRCDTYQGWS